MRRHLPIAPLALAAVLAATLADARPASADWLVTRDGARVETKGPWKVDGRRVLFTLPNGTLSVMRASEVDLEASELATQQALAPPPPPVVEEKRPLPEPVLVLTNKDIPSATEEGDGTPRPEVVPSIAEREPVQVVSWKRLEVEDGLELRGTVRNTGSALAANITVRAEVKDEDGEVIGTGNAFLGNSSLVSGRSTSFRIVLPEVDDFAGEPTFSVTSTKLTVGGAAVSRNGGQTAEAAEDDSELPEAAAGPADAAGPAGETSDSETAADDELAYEEPGEQEDTSAERP